MDQMDDAGVEITKEIEEKIAKRREQIESGETEETDDIKAKIADIERRRKLSKIVDLDTGVSDYEIGTKQPEPGVQVTYYLPEGKTTDGRNISEIPAGSIDKYTTETKVFYGFEEAEQQAKDWIKSKYDAELAALKGNVEEPINDIYKGQLVFMTPGSGKSFLASKNPNVIDADMLLVETASQLNPEFKPNPDATGFQNINKALQFVDRQELYNKTFKKIQALKQQGKTVVTGSRAFIKFADFVMVQSDKNITAERIKDGYDMNIELDEINKLQKPFIAVSGYAAGVLKLTPKELIALNVPAYKAESEDNTEDDLDETPITLQEINQNINFENLAISMDRGYDVIVKNNRFTIVKINKKSVTLKDLGGNSVRVKPEEITMVVDGKGVTATGEEIDTVNNNKDILTKAEVEPTKGLTKEELLERIKNNNCKPTS